LIGEKLASDTALYKSLCICSGRRRKETCTEGFTYEGPSGDVMATETSMYFGQELPSLLFGDTSLKNSSSTFLAEFSFMNLVGFRASNYATGLILVLRELPPIKVGQEGFGPWSNDSHDYMGGRCHFGARAPDDIAIVFGI
jgi:hypothetical protein